MIEKILLLFSWAILCQGYDLTKPVLKQVVVLSRHNIRTTIRPDLLPKYSPKTWPEITQKPGQLTKKGTLMEQHMGEYFKEWLDSENFFRPICPDVDTVYLYANSMNRTVQTAEAFAEGAFEDCYVPVHHEYSYEKMEEMFRPIISNGTAAFKNMVFNEINQKLKDTKLKESLLELNEILDIKFSEICKTESICDLSDTSKSKITFAVGRELWVEGPLYVANTVLDSFYMSYYEGAPLKDVAWGLLKTPEIWHTVTEITRKDQRMRYSTIARDYGSKLKKCITKIMLNYAEMPKFILIVGHDFNQNALTTAMDFKPFTLPNHYELYPMGGKIVFQRWIVDANEYLKIEYIYPSWTQLRSGAKFTMKSPPQRVVLELKWCKADANGFCSWSEFIRKLSAMQ